MEQTEGQNAGGDPGGKGAEGWACVAHAGQPNMQG